MEFNLFGSQIFTWLVPQVIKWSTMSIMKRWFCVHQSVQDQVFILERKRHCVLTVVKDETINSLCKEEIQLLDFKKSQNVQTDETL